MGTIVLTQKAPFLSRAKRAIGVMMAVVALGGAVQAATPDSASALKPLWAEYCMDVYSLYIGYSDIGNKQMADYYKGLMNSGNCWGAVNGL